MGVQVLIAVPGPRESAIAAAVGAAPALTVARRCADLGEALAAAEAGVGDAVVVGIQRQLTRETLAGFMAAGLTVVGAPADDDEALRLEGLGVATMLSPGKGPEALVPLLTGAVREVTAPPLAAPRPLQRSTLVAVWGPAGAPGRTTIATALAYELAHTIPTILVDADTYGGAVAQALGLLDEAPGLAALARASTQGALTGQTVSKHALRLGERLSVISGISRADRWPELSTAALDQVWERLRDHAHIVVVDCGFSLESDEELQYDTNAPQRNAATLSALSVADHVVAVGTAEPLGVQRLVHTLPAASSAAPTAEVTVVVNRVRAAVAGARPREAVADALKRYAGVEEVWTVPWDPRACDAATLAGQALGEKAPRSQVNRAIQGIAQHLVARRAALTG